MGLRKFSSNYIFCNPSRFLKNGIIILDEENRVIDIIDNQGNLQEEAKLEYYNGILIPGLIGNHFHSDPDPIVFKYEQHEGNILAFNRLLRCQQINPFINLFDILNSESERVLGFKYRGFEKGSITGVNLIENANLAELKLMPGSKLRILVKEK